MSGTNPTEGGGWSNRLGNWFMAREYDKPIWTLAQFEGYDNLQDVDVIIRDLIRTKYSTLKEEYPNQPETHLTALKKALWYDEFKYSSFHRLLTTRNTHQNEMDLIDQKIDDKFGECLSEAAQEMTRYTDTLKGIAQKHNSPEELLAAYDTVQIDKAKFQELNEMLEYIQNKKLELSATQLRLRIGRIGGSSLLLMGGAWAISSLFDDKN